MNLRMRLPVHVHSRLDEDFIRVLGSQNIHDCIIKSAYFKTVRHHFNCKMYLRNLTNSEVECTRFIDIDACRPPSFTLLGLFIALCTATFIAVLHVLVI